jgi:pyruvate/2-oxoglutarate dehydrogenase complex dihydrolipoamide dehydrogenase (E3) component
MFSLETLPERLLILGAGPVGVEMAQAYARLGSRVSLIEQAQRILPGFDRDISRLLKQQLRADGVDIVHGVVERVQQQGDVKKVVLNDGSELSGDQVKMASGSTPECRHQLGIFMPVEMLPG